MIFMKTNYELGMEYLQKAEKIKEKIDFLTVELEKKSNLKGACDRVDVQKRLRVLYEMYIDLKAVGNKLTGGKKNV